MISQVICWFVYQPRINFRISFWLLMKKKIYIKISLLIQESPLENRIFYVWKVLSYFFLFLKGTYNKQFGLKQKLNIFIFYNFKFAILPRIWPLQYGTILWFFFVRLFIQWTIDLVHNFYCQRKYRFLTLPSCLCEYSNISSFKKNIFVKSE